MDAAPEYIHRVKSEIKHLGVTGENLILVNNPDENVDVYLEDSPQVFQQLNIQQRQMNCSIVVGERLFIGCRDRRVFVYDKQTLELQKVIEVAESVHCFCALKNDTQVVIGMTEGNVLILDCSVDVVVLMEGKFRDVGGIWAMCGCNNDNDIAIGTIGGLFMLQILDQKLLRTDECYLPDKNIWNVREYDNNKLICTCWVTPHTYFIDRNDTKSMKKPTVIEEKNSKNNHATDLWLLPGYSF